jgi:hypothetical protein
MMLFVTHLSCISVTGVKGCSWAKYLGFGPRLLWQGEI